MPNGFYGSAEEWERLEAPFRVLDGELERFANARGLGLTRNYHDWPSRWLEWGRPIVRRIAVYRVEGDRLAVRILAWEDRRGARYTKEETLLEGSPEEVRATLPETLERAKRAVDAWRAEDLELAVRLGKTTPTRFALAQLGGWAATALVYLLPILALAWLLSRAVSCASE